MPAAIMLVKTLIMLMMIHNSGDEVDDYEYGDHSDGNGYGKF